MVYLISEGLACGVAQTPEVRTPFLSLEEAEAQAEQDLTVGRTPLRIEDGMTGAVLWEPRDATTDEG